MLNSSRLRCLTGGAAVLFCSVVNGQVRTPCDGPSGATPGCATPAPYPPPRRVYVCPCPTCQDHRGLSETAPGEPELGPGAYVAPPQTGVQVASSRQLSIGGLAIRFPEFRLELPTIELPRRMARTRGAHMELDRAVADFRSFPAQPTPQLAYAARQEVQPGEPETGQPSPESGIDEMRKRCECMAEQLRQKEALLNSKLMELEHQLAMLHSVPARCPVPPAQCLAPPTPPAVQPSPSVHPRSAEELPVPLPEAETDECPGNLRLEHLHPPLPLTGQENKSTARVALAAYYGSLQDAPLPATLPGKRPIRLPRP